MNNIYDQCRIKVIEAIHGLPYEEAIEREYHTKKDVEEIKDCLDGFLPELMCDRCGCTDIAIEDARTQYCQRCGHIVPDKHEAIFLKHDRHHQADTVISNDITNEDE